MRILEVILEGFKSYPHRTVFRNFDNSFNAITGLNGSGKSNFLDAIIFVLGISKNLHLLRINKLSELIYKNAMGNISKAEVTVVFDNTDNQPIGYEDCATITATRIIESDKSKYYINGKTARLKDYKDMFRQVKLSIESPSFIVTQGRIAKIITLKPKELLELIEDTVGTLFFRTKKAEVTKGVDKEMELFKEYGQRVLSNIGPQLVKIRTDLDIRSKIDKLTTQIEQLEKKIVAVGVEYHNKKITEIIFEQEKYSRNLEQSQKHELFLVKKQKDCEQKVDKRKKQEDKYQKLQEYQLQTTQDQIEVRGLQNKLQNCQKDFQKQDQFYKIRQEQKIDIMREIESSQNLVPQILQQIVDLEDNIRSKRDDQERIQFSSDQDQRQLVGDNITATTQELNSLTNKFKQIRDNLNRQNEKARQRVQLRALSQNEITQLKNKVEQLQPKKQELLNQIAPLKDMENKLKAINSKLISQAHQLKLLRQEKDQPEFNSINISEQARKILPQNLEFDTLVTRCRFKQQLYEQYKYVINESMLGSLGTVICENTEQANILCKYSFQLFNNRSVTIQTKADFNNQNAMSQLVEQQIRNDAVDYKQKLVFLWELLDIEPDYKKFFDKQFQQQVIIDNLKENDFGKYLASHHGLRVFNPDGDLISDGIVSGGYRGENQVRTRNADLICRFHGIIDKIENLRISIQKLENERDELTYNSMILKQHDGQLQEIVKLIEKTNKEIERQEQILSENALSSINDDIYLLEEEEIEYQKKISDCEKQLKEYADQLKLCQGGQKVDKQIKRIDFEVDDLKKQLFKKQKQKDEIEDQRKNKERQLQDLEEELIKLEENKKELSQSLNEQKNILQEKQQQLEERLREQAAQKDLLEGPEEINMGNQLNYQDDLCEQIKQIQIEIRYLQQERPAIIQEINRFKEEIKLNQIQIQEIKQNHLYDQTSIEISQGKLIIDIQESLSQYEQLKDQVIEFKQDIKILQQQLNFKKLSQKQIEISKNFENIGKEIQTVFNSANKLREELDECEQIRESTVRRCVAKVSEDFSMIFKTLYPQASAELRGIGEVYTENGLEVIVKMEGKEIPLSQLSGGQKSLLAVSLLMALLRYFPSPFYLLDEIDSALDIEHTEKLGLIFATHFKTAQFILISLKSQMFKSAPVIFSVTQTAGVSSIQRDGVKTDEKALQKQLQGYNINLEEHQSIEEKRQQQQKSRKNRQKRETQQYGEESAKEDSD